MQLAAGDLLRPLVEIDASLRAGLGEIAWSMQHLTRPGELGELGELGKHFSAGRGGNFKFTVVSSSGASIQSQRLCTARSLDIMMPSSLRAV